MSGQINVNNERFSDVKKKNQKWMIQSRKGHHISDVKKKYQKWMIQSRKGHHRLLLSKQQQEQFKGQ
jgi:hypothetical protein